MSIDAILSEIAKARTQAQLWARLVRCGQALGFGAIGYLLLDKGRTGRAIAMLQHGYDPEVVRLYVQLGNGLHDPTLRVAFTTGRPWRFSEVLSRFTLSKSEQLHKERVNEFPGARDGMGFPLFGPNGRDAYAVLGRPAGEDILDRADRTALHMMAQAAHLKAIRLRAPQGDDGWQLSEREVEILRWVAQGKSNAAIATILEISAGTVDTYLRRIFEKLGVTDRTTAAVKGVSTGLIRA
ncbi:MAG TPA: LuxR C-terminal-related transcriptional regulator [Sphingobium sp.]